MIIKRRFLDIEVGWAGSVGDARLFQNSYLANTYEAILSQYGTMTLLSGDDAIEDIPAFILGDSAYPNTRYLVTTYKVTECETDSSIRHLNHRLSRARYHVEHAFGILKGRFQIFAKPLRSASEDFTFAMHLIASIFVLHNFLIDTQDAVPENNILSPEIVAQLQESESGTRGDELDTLLADEAEEEVTVQEELNNGYEPTRNALLRHIRWLDEFQ